MKTSVLLKLGAFALSLMASHIVQAAASTWGGTTSAQWTNAANWSPGIPNTGDDVIIADTTPGNALSMADSRTIGNMLFGATGTRTTTFQITNTVASNTLTFTSGFTANGNAGALATVEFFRVPIVIANDQVWTIGGPAGSASADAGIRLRERATGVQSPVTINGTWTKNGPGQLSFVGNLITNGNIIVNQGSLKLNAGGTTLLTLTGPGTITVSNGASLMFSRNSGSNNITKPVFLYSGSTIQFGGGNTTPYVFPITWNGNVTLSAANSTDNTTTTALMVGDWTGTSAITTANVNAASRVLFYVLSNNMSGWSGSLANNGNGVRIGFATNQTGNANVAWSLGNAGAILETFGATSISLGSLGGASGIFRNNNAGSVAATATVGALGTSTTFGGTMMDNAGAVLSVIKLGAGTMTLTGTNTFSGGLNVNNGAVVLQGAFSAAGSGAVTVQSGATFGGSGNASGAVSILAGATIRADGGVGSPPLNVGSLTFGTGPSDLTTSSINVYLGGKVVNSSSLTLNGTNTVNIVGAAPAVGVYDLITYSGGIGGTGFPGFVLGSLPFGVVAHLQDSGTAVQLNVTAVTIEPGIWSGNVLGQWNLAGGLEWKGATSGSPQPYHDLDAVTFNDAASNFTVNVTANVTPAVVTVANTTAYTFSGVAGIIGSTSLSKNGSGTLLILNSNSYSGGTFITNGTLQLGNGGTSGSISGLIDDNGAIIANRTDTNTLLGPISGTGTITQQGSGTLVLGGANTYLGLTTVSAGILATASGSALGDTNTGTIVANGATLDENSQTLGAEPITATGVGVGGGGAIVNNGAGDNVNALRYVTLTGPTTFGGARRWDVRHPTPANDPNGGGGATLTGNNNDLTKVSSNVVAFINVGDTGLRDINIQGGTLTFSRSTFLGDSSRTITVNSNGTLQLHRTSEFIDNALNKVVTITNGTFAVEANGLTNRFVGPVTLTFSNTISLPAATGLILENTVNGNGSVTAGGGGLLSILGSATYGGGTTLAGAVLRVDGTLGNGAHPLTITAASTVSGNGTILDPVTIPSGSSLSPGDSIGALNINNTLVLSAGSSNVFEVNKDAGTNDVVKGLTSVTYGGTLSMVNVGSTGYAPGDNFKLFYAGSYSGSFSTIVPATPALGLIWVTNNLPVNGTISVAVLPNPIPLFAHSASSLVGTNVNVTFSAALDPAVATDISNYKLTTSNQVINATMVAPTNVLLGLDSPLTNSSFLVNIKNVRDQAYVPNVVATTNVPGTASGFLEAVPILITNGLAFAYGTNGLIKIYSDGSDIFGTQDHFEFVYTYMTNDFDIAVMLQSLLITDPAAKAGIILRDVIDPTIAFNDERFYMVAGFTADPARNNNFVQYREDRGATAVAPGAPRPAATYPNNWLRLKRTGSILQGYAGPNGLDWTPMTSVDSSTNAPGAYPSVVRVGLAVTAHNAAATTEAIFSNFGKAVERGVLSFTVSGSNLVISWQSSLTGATLQRSPSVQPTTWTPVPGSTLTNTVYIPLTSSNAFFRLAQ